MDETGTISAALIGHSSFEYLGTQRDGQTVIACGCHNPDGNGDGSVTFSGHDLADALSAWMDHVGGVVEVATTANATKP